jgi:hypothetical protein
MKHPWPELSEKHYYPSADGVLICMWLEPDPPMVACKHDHDECERCGTTNRRDVKHRTINGRGAIARLGR